MYNVAMSRIENVLFCITHPAKAAGAKLRQAEVACDLALPPHLGTTIEEFPKLSVKQAAELITAARKAKVKLPNETNELNILGGIPESAWSKSAVQDLANGSLKAPDGRHPDHDNL